MRFPFTYTGELVFYKPEGFKMDLFIKQIQLKVSHVDFSEGQLTFISNFSYSKLPVKIVLTIRDYNTSIYCSYKISLFENNVALLLSLVFTIFFYHFNSILFAVISIVGGLLFYFFNLLKISNGVKALIYSSVGKIDEVGEPALWQQQQQWMKNKKLCPACGEQKNAYSNKCINCGLHFSKKKEKFSNINTSGLGNNSISYEVNKNKK